MEGHRKVVVGASLAGSSLFVGSLLLRMAWPNPLSPPYLHTTFPEMLIGTWVPDSMPQSILGPVAYNFANSSGGAFTAQRDPSTGDVWMTLLQGQTFRIRDTAMQYCFGFVEEVQSPAEQSPFSVAAVSDSSITLCWRAGLPGMQTHAKDCRGCDCAKLTITAKDDDSAELLFQQSPPHVHAHFQLKRNGPAPDMEIVKMTYPQPYLHCRITDGCLDWQFCPKTSGSASVESLTPTSKAGALDPTALRRPPRRLGGCAASVVNEVMSLTAERGPGGMRKDDLTNSDAPARPSRNEDAVCYQLNGFNHMVNTNSPASIQFPIPDVQLQVRIPTGKCDPCNVTYAVSAALEDDEYVGVGFKGESWEGQNQVGHSDTSRPCYFGMCVDDYDSAQSKHIAVGYATSGHGACVREMEAEPNLQDVASSARSFSGTRVQRNAGRTIFHFTVPQRWPAEKGWDGWYRVMWAKGVVSGGQNCDATVNFHGINRGVAPLEWLNINSRPCSFSDEYPVAFV